MRYDGRMSGDPAFDDFMAETMERDYFERPPDPTPEDYPWIIQTDAPGAGYGALSLMSERELRPGVYMLTLDEMTTLANHLLFEVEQATRSKEDLK